MKNTRLTERTSLQFRADMFNVFNRVGRGDPDTDLADGLPSAGGTFGSCFPYSRPTAAREDSVRHIQPGRGLGLKFVALRETDRPNLIALLNRLRSLQA